jgi:hypothetical protein
MSSASEPSEAPTPTPDQGLPSPGDRPAGSEPQPEAPVQPPPRAAQDTQPVEGEDALHPPPGTEQIQRQPIQG